MCQSYQNANTELISYLCYNVMLLFFASLGSLGMIRYISKLNKRLWTLVQEQRPTAENNQLVFFSWSTLLWYKVALPRPNLSIHENPQTSLRMLPTLCPARLPDVVASG